MKRHIWIGMAVIGAVLAGCGRKEESSHAEVAMPASEGKAAVANSGGKMEDRTTLASAPNKDPRLSLAAANKALKRAVIRNGNLTIRVKSVEESEKSVAAIAAGAGGYIANTESTDLEGDAASLKISLKVDSNEFDATLAALEKLGSRLSKKTQTQDVTGQLVDLGARLKIMRAQENALRTMLRQASNSVELMDVQERIMRLREEIESLGAQQQSLAGLAALSTIELTLEQSAAGAVPPGDPNWAQESWGAASAAISSAGRGLGSLAIWILLFMPIWVPALLVLRGFVKASRKVEVPG